MQNFRTLFHEYGERLPTNGEIRVAAENRIASYKDRRIPPQQLPDLLDGVCYALAGNGLNPEELNILGHWASGRIPTLRKLRNLLNYVVRSVVDSAKQNLGYVEPNLEYEDEDDVQKKLKAWQAEWVANALKIRPEAKESRVEEPSDEPESIRVAEAKELSLEVQRRRSPNAERNTVIVNCLERRMARAEICRILDEKGLATTPQMNKNGVHRWTDAWNDPEFQKNVQQTFTKTWKRHGPVKS